MVQYIVQSMHSFKVDIRIFHLNIGFASVDIIDVPRPLSDGLRINLI